jgi:hemolysin III
MHRFKEPTSGFTHLAGAIFGVVALILLTAYTWDEPDKMVSMLVYGISLVLLYSASAALHLIKSSPRLYLWLNRFDHAAIYCLIAGTYTPFCYNVLTGSWRWGMLSVIWGLALLGVLFKLVFMKKEGAGHLSTLLYVGMGWVAIIALPKLLEGLPVTAVWWMAIGGIIYSAGAVIFALQRPNFHKYFNFHDLWHIFVLAGSGIHFGVIFRYLVLA